MAKRECKALTLTEINSRHRKTPAFSEAELSLFFHAVVLSTIREIAVSDEPTALAAGAAAIGPQRQITRR